MPLKSISALDRRVFSAQNDVLGNTVGVSTEQTILVTDIISEGPIGGLVNGTASVFLNNDPIDSDDEAVYSNAVTEVTLTAGSKTATVTKNGQEFTPTLGDEGTRFLLVYDATSTNVKLTSFNRPEALAGVWSGSITRLSGFSFDSSFNTDNQSLKAAHGKRLFNFRSSGGLSFFNITCNTTDIAAQTAALMYPATGGAVFQESDLTTDASNPVINTLTSDLFLEIESVGTDSVNLKNNSSISGTFKFLLTSPDHFATSRTGLYNTNEKHNKSGVRFNPGTLEQRALTTLEGVGTSSTSLPILNQNLVKFVPANENYTTVTATGAQAALIDEVKFIINYPQGCYLIVDRSSSTYTAGVAYLIEMSLNEGSGFGAFKVVEPGSSNQSGMFDSNGDGTTDTAVWTTKQRRKSSFSQEIKINLEALKPFTAFKFRISRLTKNKSDDYTTEARFGTPADGGGGIDSNLRSSEGSAFDQASGGEEKHITGVYESQLTQALGVIKEKLTFPYTAYANTVFSSKTFQTSPTRSYECFGMKVKVPSNYITREENDGFNAKYTRNSERQERAFINGMTSPVLWDGNFRQEKHYTDNPAWVFYDICTNDRYGLGDHLKESDIDKFSLYKVAKYCDELVPDGKGGTEPRFRSNIYLTKATDAYKILKDFATVFRGILYWSNSQFFASMDEPKEPIYTFSRSNVIDGAFDYQSTGSKTRANQIVVSWNNPENEYKLEPLIIEDRENILKTKSIKSEKAVAFGCTSEGQAIRYGRWKLWTAVNQTEIVSFKTGINAAFLSPGDIVNIQDETDYRVPFSGRVSSCTSSAITIDRDISSHLSGSFDYTICAILSKKTIVLNQNTATIANSGGTTTTFSRGEEVTHATVGNSTVQLIPNNGNEDTTNRNIVSAVDSSGSSINLQYVEQTLVEERLLNTSSISTTDGKNTIDLGSAFSVLPTNGDVWAIKETSTTGVPTIASYKPYKVLDIKESGKTEYHITAVEHYNTKFDLIEQDFNLAVPDVLYQREGATVQVPRPLNLRVLRTPMDTSPGEELTLEWDPPAVQSTDPDIQAAFTEYEHLGEFEIQHSLGDDSGLLTGTRVSRDARSVPFTKVPQGSQVFGVTTISNKGRRSPQALFNITVDDIFEGNHERIGGIVKGGYSTRDIDKPINTGSQKGTVKFSGTSYIAAPFTSIQSAKENTSADPDTYALSCTALANSAYPAGAIAYIFMDFSALSLAAPNANALKVITRKVDSTTFGSTIDYWYDATKYVASASNIWTTVTTSASVTQGSSQIVGSGFLALKIPQVVTIGSAFAGKIAHIVSDTLMYLDRPWTAANASSQTLSKQELEIDFRKDFLIGSVSYDSSGAGTYKLGGGAGAMSYLDITPNLEDVTRALLVTSNIPLLSYQSDNTQNTLYDNIQLNIATPGYSSPEVNVTGAGFSQVNTLTELATSFTAATNGVLTKIVHTNNAAIAFSNTNINFTVKVREALDPDNVSKQRTFVLSIGKIKEGEAGAASALVYLYKSSVSVPASPTSSFPTVTVALSGTGGGTITNPSTALVGEAWYKIPQTPGAGEKLWIVAATGNSTGTSDTIPYNEWTSPPTQFSGSDGFSSKTVEIFKPSASGGGASTKPIGNTTYTFATGATSFANSNGWTLALPNLSSSTPYMYKRTAAAIGTGATDIIPDSEWSSAALVSQPGADGVIGKKNASGYLYYNTQQASAPSAPSSSSVSILWSTGVLSGGVIGSGATNWNQIAPTSSGGTSGSKMYYVYWSIEQSAVDAANGANTGAVTLGTTVYTATNFTGLVRFNGTNNVEDGSGNGLSFGSSGTTTIDGGKITTGTISAARISLSGHPLETTVNNVSNVAAGAATAAASAASTANTADGNATSALNAANSKNKFFRQDTAPTATAIGDLWVDTNGSATTAPNQLYRASGTGTSNWVAIPAAIGGWQLNQYAIFSGTAHGQSSTGYTTGNNHITLNSNGSINAKNFYLNANGTAGFRGTITVGGTDLTASNTLDQVQGAFTANTAISGGKIVLASESTSNITLNSGTKQITVTDAGVIRVIIGKLS